MIRSITASFLLVISVTVPSFSETLHVPAQHATIQAAVDAAVEGDVVRVAPGTYLENVDFLGKGITLESELGPEVTTIDGGSRLLSVVSFVNNEATDSVLRGFTLTNGKGTYYPRFPGSDYAGGGIFCLNASPTIAGNVIKGNRADDGGGIFGSNASPFIHGNTITGNTASYEMGGGILLEGSASPIVYDNDITDNQAEYHGGGFAMDIYFGFPLIKNNRVTQNRIIGASGGGGGMFVNVQYNEFAVDSNYVADNQALAGEGGGIYCWNGCLLMNNTVLRNDARDGGGVFSLGEDGEMMAVNNVVCLNTAQKGGGFFLEGGFIGFHQVEMTQNTIACNSAEQGGGIYQELTIYEMEISNTILWGNEAIEGPAIYASVDWHNDTLALHYTNLEGGVDSIFHTASLEIIMGRGMIDADPLFVDPGGGDYHIPFGSPCRNAACREYTLFMAADMEGDPRRFQFYPDMGADEFHTHLYCTGDADPGSAVQIKHVGMPGAADVIFCIGTSVLDPPQYTAYGNWYLGFPLIAAVQLPPIPSSGVLTTHATLPSTWVTPYMLPLQSLIGDQFTNLFELEVK